MAANCSGSVCVRLAGDFAIMGEPKSADILSKPVANSSPLLNVLFRASVVIGCATMLLGVAGIFYFRDRAPPEVTPPSGDTASVIVDTPAAKEDLEVVVRWTEGDGSHGEERGRRGKDPVTWHFRRAPQAVPVDLVVYVTSAGQRRELHRTEAVLQRGAHYHAVLPRVQPQGVTGRR